jgi:hypothetical protein
MWLCVHQRASLPARRLAKEYGVVVWWCTSIEMRSALELLLRTGQLSAVEHAGAGKRLGQMTRGWREVRPSHSLRFEAEGLLSRFPLRAVDALQLAAAMTWSTGRPQGRAFIFGAMDSFWRLRGCWDLSPSPLKPRILILAHSSPKCLP